MADRRLAGQPLDQIAAGESLGHVAHVPLGVETLAVEGRYAAGLLAPVLQGVQAERGDLGRALGAEDAEDAAFEP